MTKEDIKKLCDTLSLGSYAYERCIKIMDKADIDVLKLIKGEIIKDAIKREKEKEADYARNLQIAQDLARPIINLLDFPAKLQVVDSNNSNIFGNEQHYQLIDNDGWVVIDIHCRSWGGDRINWEQAYRYAKKTNNNRLFAYITAQHLGSKAKE